ncbi:hypothetical protein [Flaviaesturariibacter amylovorans]
MNQFLPAAALLLLAGCSKVAEAIADRATTDAPATDAALEYLIEAGAHSANQNAFRSVSLTEQKFTVRFDSSAIYTTRSAENQYDINKLWGFSDNGGNHHQFSARFGWRWSDGALRLFGYVYNGGRVSSAELGAIAIGADHSCSIRTTARHYVFSVNGRADSLPRTAATARAEGYQLYPYFGGDEPAPHRVRIWIRETK